MIANVSTGGSPVDDKVLIALAGNDTVMSPVTLCLKENELKNHTGVYIETNKIKLVNTAENLRAKVMKYDNCAFKQHIILYSIRQGPSPQ